MYSTRRSLTLCEKVLGLLDSDEDVTITKIDVQQTPHILDHYSSTFFVLYKGYKGDLRDIVINLFEDGIDMQMAEDFCELRREEEGRIREVVKIKRAN